MAQRNSRPSARNPRNMRGANAAGGARNANSSYSRAGSNSRGAASQPAGFRSAYTPELAAKSSRHTGSHSAAGASGVGDLARTNAKYSVKSKRGRGKKIALIVCLVLALVLVGAGVATALYMNSLNQEMAIDDPEQAAAIDAALTPVVSTEPFYMLIIGSDTRNDGEGQRSDTNIVARVDMQKGIVTLISIPRDTAITIDGYGTQKFNAAYAYDGAAGAIKAASNLLGVNISHYVEIDFDGAIDLVDSIGGVTVDVPMTIDDADAGGYVPQGVQTLDGEHALIFARSRHYTTGDFQRTTSQRILVEAVVKKVSSLPATELPGLVQKAAKYVTTDMSVTDIIGYAQLFQKANNVTMYSALVPSSTAELNGISYVVCDTATLKQMMAIVNEGGDPSTVATDSTVTSSAEAKAEGQEAYTDH